MTDGAAGVHWDSIARSLARRSEFQPLGYLDRFGFPTIAALSAGPRRVGFPPPMVNRDHQSNSIEHARQFC